MTQGEFLLCDAILVIDEAIGVGHGDRLGADLFEFSKVYWARCRSRRTVQILPSWFASALEHFLGEVDAAVSGGLGSDEGAAPSSGPCR